MSLDTQEPRKDTIAAAVTATEKWRVQLVKRKTGEDVSELLRKHSLNELIEMGRKLDEALGELPATVAAAV